MPKRPKHFILKIENFEGKDTHITCGDYEGRQNFVYCIVVTNDDGTAEILDCGYRSEREIRDSWQMPTRKPKR